MYVCMYVRCRSNGRGYRLCHGNARSRAARTAESGPARCVEHVEGRQTIFLIDAHTTRAARAGGPSRSTITLYTAGRHSLLSRASFSPSYCSSRRTTQL